MKIELFAFFLQMVFNYNDSRKIKIKKECSNDSRAKSARRITNYK